MTYAFLAILTSLAGLVALFLGRKRLRFRAVFVAAAALLLLTTVFDNLIIFSGIVAYDESLITGIKIWFAPIEDFSYTIFAVSLVPVVFESLGKK